MEPLVIIVPGLEAPRWPRPFNYIVRFYSWYFALNAGKSSWMHFAEYLRLNNVETTVAEPIYWFSNKTIQVSGNEVARLIDSHEGREIILFGYSLGTAVIEEAVKKSLKVSRILKIISVAAPHSRDTLNITSEIKVMNIYSDADRYLDFANRMLYLHGYKRLKNADNIQLDNIRHADFCNPTLYDFYLSFIK